MVKVIKDTVRGYVAVVDPVTVSKALPVPPVFVLQARVPDPRLRARLLFDAHVVPVPMASANTPKRIRCRTISL